ncbi:PAS domain-containing protein [Caulobacter sp. DWR2-3-1b2]|uniref:PAS domain-containing protein n=1 Tax=Caulobacter sp. DWR2-3-1b2 TaxID=2804642 RepID=UPI003CF5D8B4
MSWTPEPSREGVREQRALSRKVCLVNDVRRRVSDPTELADHRPQWNDPVPYRFQLGQSLFCWTCAGEDFQMSERELAVLEPNRAFLDGEGDTRRRLRVFDWTSTLLGAPAEWPPVLKALVELMLNSKQPMFVGWGKDRIWLYNDAFNALVGPEADPPGLADEQRWPYAGSPLQPVFERVFTGASARITASTLGLDVRGRVDAHFDITPVRGERGGVTGLLGVWAETPAQIHEDPKPLASIEEEREQLFEMSRDLLAVATYDGFLRRINPAWSHHLGRSEEDLLARPFSEIIHPDDLPFAAQVVGALQKGEPVHKFRIRLLRSDGQAIAFSWSAVPNPQSGSQTFYTVGRDVTDDAPELRRSEARLRFLDTLNRALSTLDNADAILAITTRMVGEYMGGSNCAYADMDADQDGFTVRGDWAAPGSQTIVGHYRLADFGKLAVANLGAGRPLIVMDNLAELAPEEAATFQAIGIAATICMPLVKDGRLTALMAIHDAAPRSWTEDDLALIGEVTQRSWAHIQRVGAEAALRTSHGRFEAAVAAVEGLIWTNDPEGRMVGEQPGWAGLTGQSRDEYQGYGWAAAVHPEDAQPTVDAWEEAVRERKPFLFEHRLRRADGAWRTFSIRAVPTFGSDGSIVEWVGVHTDITAQRAAETELRDLAITLEKRVAAALAERRLLADIVEGTDAFVQVVDLEFLWMAVNRAAADEFERIYGVRPKAGLSMLDLLAPQPDHQAEVRSVWARALGGEEFTEVGEFGDATRGRRSYEMKYNVLRDASGEQIGAYQFAYDVTDRVREQKRLRFAETQLRQVQKMEAMGQLTGGVAHDFNNLLTPILGALDMLERKGARGEREQRLVSMAIQSAERAKTLVQRLLAFARRQPLQSTTLDVSELVAGMADLVASTIGPHIKVVVELEDRLPPALADANQLEMALLNLAVNARDAMEDNGTLRLMARSATIKRGDRADLEPGRYVIVSIADTGVGMDQATLARAIEPFFSTKGVGKGTGLGLSMVHGLAEQLGGSLTIQSGLGVGTTVELWLPQSEEAVRPTTGDPEISFLTEGPKGTVLLVDDEESVRAITAEMLTDMGWAVQEASSAETALAMIEAGLRPSLIVTDHLMPGMTGVEMAAAVKVALPEVPILLVSGFAEHSGVSPELPLLSKPFRNTDLARSVACLTARPAATAMTAGTNQPET